MSTRPRIEPPAWAASQENVLPRHLPLSPSREGAAADLANAILLGGMWSPNPGPTEIARSDGSASLRSQTAAWSVGERDALAVECAPLIFGGHGADPRAPGWPAVARKGGSDGLYREDGGRRGSRTWRPRGLVRVDGSRGSGAEDGAGHPRVNRARSATRPPGDTGVWVNGGARGRRARRGRRSRTRRHRTSRRFAPRQGRVWRTRPRDFQFGDRGARSRAVTRPRVWLTRARGRSAGAAGDLVRHVVRVATIVSGTGTGGRVVAAEDARAMQRARGRRCCLGADYRHRRGCAR